MKRAIFISEDRVRGWTALFVIVSVISFAFLVLSGSVTVIDGIAYTGFFNILSFVIGAVVTYIFTKDNDCNCECHKEPKMKD